MSGQIAWTRVVTEFVLRIPEEWRSRMADAVDALAAAGATITRVAADRRTLAGVVESTMVQDLQYLPCTEGIIEGATYLIDGSGHPAQVFHDTGGQGSQQYWQALTTSVAGVHMAPSCRAPRPRVRRHPGDAAGQADDLLDMPLYNVPASERTFHSVDLPGDASSDDLYDLDVNRRGPSLGHARWTARAIPLGVRLAYAIVGALGAWLVVDAALHHSDNRWIAPFACAAVNGLLCSLGIVAAFGLCQFRLIRHGCTGVALLAAVLPYILWDEQRLVAAIVGFIAFLIAGTAADCCSRA